jgi:hypothetical protein
VASLETNIPLVVSAFDLVASAFDQDYVLTEIYAVK